MSGENEGLHCQSVLHKTERYESILYRVMVRLGAANRWTEQYWCPRCLKEDDARRV